LNEVELDATEKIEIYEDIRKITFTRPSVDPVKNIENKKEAIKRAEEFAGEFQAEMFKKKELIKVYEEKAKEEWTQRIKVLDINNSNIMIETTGEEMVVEGGDMF
jgi:hypothetical protein